MRTQENKIDHTSDIAKAVKDATSLIAVQASEAIKVITQAAAAAAVVVKTANDKDGNDHDLIVQLGVKMEDLRCDVKDIKDGTSDNIRTLFKDKLNISDSYPYLYKKDVDRIQLDHEARISINERRIVQVFTWGTAVIILIGIIEFILNIYVRGV